MKKILLVFTGGTICSHSENGVRSLATENAKHKILDIFGKSNCEYAKISDEIFKIANPINIFSENMDKQSLGKLVEFLKTTDLEKYGGVIILHGTDTLAYSCAMISLLFQNTGVPIIFVSANAPLDNPTSNGNANFAFAVEQILGEKISGGVFAAYKNPGSETVTLHDGYRIMQSENFSDSFFSADVPKPKFCVTHESFGGFNAEILFISPYVGIDYNLYSLENVDAVLHGTYHSGTLESNSFSEFAEKCASEGIPIYIATCKSADDDIYDSYKKIKSKNVFFLNDMTAESAYCRILAAYSAFGKEYAHAAVLDL